MCRRRSAAAAAAATAALPMMWSEYNRCVRGSTMRLWYYNTPRTWQPGDGPLCSGVVPGAFVSRMRCEGGEEKVAGLAHLWLRHLVLGWRGLRHARAASRACASVSLLLTP